MQLLLMSVLLIDLLLPVSLLLPLLHLFLSLLLLLLPVLFVVTPAAASTENDAKLNVLLLPVSH